MPPVTSQVNGLVFRPGQVDKRRGLAFSRKCELLDAADQRSAPLLDGLTNEALVGVDADFLNGPEHLVPACRLFKALGRNCSETAWVLNGLT